MNFLTLTMLAFLTAGGDEPQAKPAPPVVPAQDPDRPAISAVELKALRDTNIFAPKGAKRAPRSTYSSPRSTAPPVPYKPKPPVVTAIFLDLASREHQVIVEDRNDSSHRYFKEPKFMKAGDEWAGIKIDSINQDKVVFIKGGASTDVHLGEALPEVEAKLLSTADPSEEGSGDDGESPVPAESTTSPSPSKFRKTSTEPKTQTSDEQNRVLDEMKRKNKKKNRPGADE
jgi:hypothetical protein